LGSSDDNILPFGRKQQTPPIELVAAYISVRGIRPETLDKAGVRICATMDEVFQVLGHNRAVWAAKKAGYTCGLAISANGDPTSQSVRVRLLRGMAPELLPTVEDAKAFKGKYLGPVHELNALYQPPPSILAYNPEPHDLMLVEGSFQVLRLAQEGIDSVGISGVQNFRVSDKRSPIIAELVGRVKSENTKRLIICFDSDQRFNPQTQVAINQLALELIKVKADHEVYVAYPPNGDDGRKQGWDDFLQNKGRATFDDHLRRDMHKWEDNEYIAKCIEWQRYIAIEATGNFFDTHPTVFKEVPRSTADLTMLGGSWMLDPTATRVQQINFNHKHYLNSPYALMATITDVMPEHKEVHVWDERRAINVVNTFRFDLLAEPKRGDVSWWYDLIKNLTRDSPSAADKLIKLAAWKVQNPAGFLPIAIGLIGDQGAGKSLFMRSIGVCVGDFSDCSARLKDTDNSNWAGHLVREWAEIDPDMNEENWKMLIRQTNQIVRHLYIGPQNINSRTLHGVTNNQIKQLVSKGDRVMVFGGFGKRLPNSIGLKYKNLIGDPSRPGPGINALRYHLLYEIDTTGVEEMDNRTEILGDVIEASQSRSDDIIDEVIFNLEEVVGLEILPSGVVQAILERLGYKGSWMSLRKSTTRLGTPLLKEGIKIDGTKIRFCVLKNHDFWKTCDDLEAYKKQYRLALPFINTQKF
jgi:Domain of unknown function (DUF3854)